MSEQDLLAIAASQHGFFTTGEAGLAGISRRALSGRAKRGLIERVAHGVYRLRQYPATPHDDLYALQVAAPDATFSHDTALELYEITDLVPRTTHITVPPASGMKGRSGVTIHRSRLERDDRVLRDGLWVTSLARTLLDGLRTGVDTDQLLEAFAIGVERALLGPGDIARLSLREPYRSAGR